MELLSDVGPSTRFPLAEGNLSTRNWAGQIFIANLDTNQISNINESIINVQIDYQMSESSQLSFDVLESATTDYTRYSRPEGQFAQELAYATNNYFVIGRDVIYETQTLGTIANTGPNKGYAATKQTQLFEIASVDISQGGGGSPQWSVRCYSKAIQQMKRDRTPSKITGTGTEFVKRAALKYGLKFWGQQTSKKQNITKAGGDKQAESLWEVIGKLAGDAKFVVFEVDGYLIFASEKYILHKWGADTEERIVTDKKTKKKRIETWKYIPLQYPTVTKGTPGYFFPLQWPTINLSDNDPFYGDGTMLLDRTNATQIRPGMTAYIGDVPNLNGYYLIESVSFTDRTPDPVTVRFRKPARGEKEFPPTLRIGGTFVQTGDSINDLKVIRSARINGGPIPPPIDGRIIPLPTLLDEYSYPRLKSPFVTTVGNIPLYSRPVLWDATTLKPKTTYSITVYQRVNLTINSGAWEATNTAVVLATIWTESGVAVQKTSAQVVSKYLADGLHLGKISDPDQAKLYAGLISQQQRLILTMRFPALNINTSVYPNTAGLT